MKKCNIVTGVFAILVVSLVLLSVGYPMMNRLNADKKAAQINNNLSVQNDGESLRDYANREKDDLNERSENSMDTYTIDTLDIKYTILLASDKEGTVFVKLPNVSAETNFTNILTTILDFSKKIEDEKIVLMISTQDTTIACLNLKRSNGVYIFEEDENMERKNLWFDKTYESLFRSDFREALNNILLNSEKNLDFCHGILYTFVMAKVR